MRAFSLSLAFLVAGCGEKAVKNASVPLDQVPESVMKVARETLPDVKFDQASRKPNGVYEIRGRSKTGKVREVELTPAGKVAEIE
jgi:hypothetical protein